MCDSLIEFFSKPTFDKWLKKEVVKSNGTVEREWATMPASMPFFEDWAWENQIGLSTMDEWVNGRKGKTGTKKTKHPEFAEAYKRAKLLQQKFLVDNGLRGFSPPAAYIFTAKNITNMRDKTEVDHTTDGKPINFVEVDYSQVEKELARRKEAQKKQGADDVRPK